jgi:hypothetical protein
LLEHSYIDVHKIMSLLSPTANKSLTLEENNDDTTKTQ